MLASFSQLRFQLLRGSVVNPPRFLAFLPGLVVLVSIALGAILFPPLPHLSISATRVVGEGYEIDRVMPGGVGWDAGLKAGMIVNSHEGGRLEAGPPPKLLDPIVVVVSDPNSGIETLVDARQLVPVRGPVRYLLWVQALLFAATGGVVFWIRGWDPASRRLLLLFGAFAVTLAVGSYSGTRGGIIPVAVAGSAISITGFSMVALLSVFPLYTPVSDWRHRFLVPSCFVGLLLAVLTFFGGFVLPDALFNLGRGLVGLYLVVTLIAAIWELLWHLRSNQSRAARAQLLTLAVTFGLGLGPLFFVALSPQLLLQAPSPHAIEISAAFTLLVPIGIAYAVIRYQSRRINRISEFFLVPFAIVLASFVVGSLAFSYLFETLSPGAPRPITPSVNMGAITAAITAAALWAAYRLATSPQIPAARSRNQEAAEAARLQVLRQLREGPARTASQLASALETDRVMSERVEEALDRLLSEFRVLMRTGGTPLPQDAAGDLIRSCERLVREAQRLTSLSIVFTASHPERSRGLSPAVSQALLVIAQEALNNVLRHAQASEAHMLLDFQEREIVFQLRDNGIGFRARDWRQRPDYFGFQQARWQAENVGGWFDVSSTLGKGTTVSAGAPPQGVATGLPSYSDSALDIDFLTREVRVRGNLVVLTEIEFRLLALLVQNAGKTLTLEDLARAAWGPGPAMELTLRRIRWHIHRLRRRIGDEARSQPLISLVRGVGYIYTPPP